MKSKVPTCKNLVSGCYKWESKFTCVPGAIYCNNALIGPVVQRHVMPVVTVYKPAPAVMASTPSVSTPAVQEIKSVDCASVPSREERPSTCLSDENNTTLTEESTHENSEMLDSTTLDESDRTQESTIKRYMCPHCQKRFARPSSLQTHIYTHTGATL